MAKLKNYYPSAAFKINGTFLEEIVSGYHTLNAANKWTLEKQLNINENNTRDGSIFLNSKYPAREIEIEYFIEGDWETRQTRFTQLMGVLNVEDAEIIFNGEPDKYVHGYFVVENDVDTFQASGSGSFKIYCPDPFKYSTTELTTTAVVNVFTVDYQGTYKAYPTLTAEFPATYDASGNQTDTSECGFVGFENQRGDILQFGDTEEKDWSDISDPATVPVNKSFSSTSGWSANSSTVLNGTQTGSVSANSGNKYIYPSSYGSASGYHGPSLSLLITGETPPIPKAFNFSWKQKFSATKKQFGGVEIILWNNNSGTYTMVGGVQILKTTKDTKCKVNLYCGSTTSAKNYTVACSKIGSCEMSKFNDTITFNVGGKTNSLTNSNITNLVANEITFHFTRNGTKTAIGSNFIYSCKLQRSVDNPENIPNTFMPSQILTVDTQNADVYLDDGSATVSAEYLGALGNDWEGFYLTTGTNNIGVEYSDFTTTPPVFTLKYRERFI